MAALCVLTLHLPLVADETSTVMDTESGMGRTKEAAQRREEKMSTAWMERDVERDA